MMVHKHWFLMARTVTVFIILVALPPVVLALLPWATSGLDEKLIEIIVNFALTLYLLVLLGFLFLSWMDYYLDMWIVTDRRLIDIEQHGLFNREIGEIPMYRIQDITIEVKGLIETLLKFGTIRIQTAGEREFLIRNVPHLYEIKDAILKQIDRNHYGRAQSLGTDQT